jgi:protoporphyrinogen oxidase
MPSRRVVIIGGGRAGLAAAYDLSRAGFRVIVLEAAPDFGGLASSFRLEGLPVERFYHFICGSDRALVDLVSEIGLKHKLHWRHTRTGFYHHGRHFAFGTPASLLKLTPVPFLQRLRFGVHVLHSRYRKEWRSLDGLSAKAWLIDAIGPDAYEVIWDPLLRVKFGPPTSSAFSSTGPRRWSIFSWIGCVRSRTSWSGSRRRWRR